ncbi:MAG TPA: sigma-54 dependent transcriptional regulator [Longimicrobiales bacterium]|jgi:DNA-binding NtrC family response regulator|nr:sigma-54 dependent transcriptional regulator [Longimicrobiales bacterium]
MAGKNRVLVADDQADVLEALRLLLKGEDFTVETVSSPAAVLAAIESRDFDALLMDLNYTRDTTSGKEGFDLLTEVQKLDTSLPVIVMTAWGSITGAVEAIRRGARDYVEKPWDNARLLSTLRTHVELGRALRESQKLQSENQLLRGKEGIPELVVESRAMKAVVHVIERVGPSEANVLITGEHGTGKEVVARLLHAASARAKKPLVTVNAGGLSEGVFESELFGHVKGAFTDAKTDRVGYFELADGGTLFLDEIGNMPPKQQAKLLRALQSGEFQRVGSTKTRRADVRVFSATNVDIGQEVAHGRFREDLLYRLNTVEVHLPPLRDRHDDIAALAMHFLRRQVSRYQKDVTGIEREAMHAMREYSWPGNVRELEHAIERAVLMTQSPQIRADDLGLRGRADGAARLEEMTLEDAEQHLIKKAIARFDGNVSRAADALGLSRSALYRRLQHYGIST